MLVELKNGETLNGHLVSCDTWMNLTLKEVVQTSPEGDKFFRLPEVYVRGNNVRVPVPRKKNRLTCSGRLNTYECRMRSSIKSRISNRVSLRHGAEEVVPKGVSVEAEATEDTLGVDEAGAEAGVDEEGTEEG